MEIIITQWALDAYLDLKHSRVIDSTFYQQTLRPDVMLLQNYPNEPKFSNGKFWSPATSSSGNIIPDGYKMKWHQVGNGRVQLRLPITILGDAFLCRAYVKSNGKKEKRMMAKFKAHIQMVRQGKYRMRGVLK